MSFLLSTKTIRFPSVSLMFTDNDELSGLIASMMDTQALIILSNIDGIYNGSPSDPNSSVIREIGHGKDLSNYIQTTKSSFGRGDVDENQYCPQSC